MAEGEAGAPGTNGKIFYEHNFRIWSMNPDGTEQTELVGFNDGNWETNPAVSPDGNKIVYVHGGHDIAVMNSDGTNPKELTDQLNTEAGDYLQPTWSPDGNKIAFSRAEDNPSNGYDIWVMNPDGSGQKNLTNTPDYGEFEPAWSPDGLEIAYTRNGCEDTPGYGSCIYKMNANGLNQTNLTTDGETKICQEGGAIDHTLNSSDPSWSSDSSKIAFEGTTSCGAGSGTNIWVMNRYGGEKKDLIQDNSTMDLDPSWSPDGSRIVFASSRSDPEFGYREIYTIDANGTPPLAGLKRLTFHSGVDDINPDWGAIPRAGGSSSTYSACFGLHPTNTPTDGNDVIVGTAGPDVLAGGAGDDQISGLQGDDRLCGNEGNDKVLGNTGNTDRIDGGLGDDLLGGGGYLPGVSGYATCGRDSGSAGELSPADSPVFNTIYGGPGVDKILGGGGVDTMMGGDGDDCLVGIDGDDKLWGESGADDISAGPGHDLAVGGNDYDVVVGGGVHDDNIDNDTLYAGSMNVQLPIWPQTCRQNGEFALEAGPVETGEASRIASKSNKLFGDDGYDILVGTNRADDMLGGLRGDDLYGFGGSDTLKGNRASDCLSGGPDSDYLYDHDPYNVKPDDKDTLWGGGAFDVLNAKDGDSYDSLNAGVDSFDSISVGQSTGAICYYDPGDVVRCS